MRIDGRHGISLTLGLVLIMIVSSNRNKIAIIGGGASGLISAYNLMMKGLNNFQIFEKNNHVGGVWKYDDTSDENPMYSTLRTNLPVEIMAFNEEFKLSDDESTNSFPGHSKIQTYLEDFALRNNLNERIRFNSKITLVERCTTLNSQTSWRVCFEDKSGNLNAEIFDFVICCNGHFNLPHFPSISGIENFKGKFLHSITYDKPNLYENQKVLVIGTKSSGTDIAYEISLVSSKVYISSRSEDLTVDVLENPDICIKPRIKCVRHGNIVEFVDGSEAEVDVIICCTGYEYSFPFIISSELTEEESMDSIVKIYHGKAVTPLYKQLFHIYYPSLAFVGLPYSVIPFPIFNFQAAWVASVIAEESHLPTLDDRLNWYKDYNKHFDDSTRSWLQYHYLGGNLQFEYMRYTAKQANVYSDRIELYISMIESIYNDNSNFKPKYPGADPSYRNRKYFINWKELSWTSSS